MRSAALPLSLVLALVSPACEPYRRLVARLSPPSSFAAHRNAAGFRAEYEGPDLARPRIPVKLIKVTHGYTQPTDLQFVPNRDDILVVLEKTGTARWENLVTRARGELTRVSVLSDSEQGLLGLAFHPAFASSGKFYLNYTTKSHGRDVSRISEWHTAVSPDGGLAPAGRERVVLEVEQPYASHNGGQLLFDPAGMLVIPFGDGGWRGDPHGNAQNPGTLLGAVLRIDVDHPSDGRAYGIPADNPFLGVPGARPEVWAIGVRNPWRASFDPRGRLVAGDVGQELWEELDVIEPGVNLGWPLREARHCYEAKTCRGAGLRDPIWEYPHGLEGTCVTGGYVYTGTRIPTLAGKYVFADFVSGRLWALDLPADGGQPVPPGEFYTLGRWPMLPSTFGRNPSGDLFVADFGTGDVYALTAGDSP